MADDHAIVRAGLRALIEQEAGFEIVAECSGILDTREAVLMHHPDVLVLDLSLPGGGLTLVPDLCEILPDLAVLVLSMHDHEPWISEALRRGVAGYVTKGAAVDELVTALRSVASGQPYLSSDLKRSSTGPSGLDELSGREQEVFLRLARGETPKQAAIDMNLSVKTVYLHRASLRGKLGACNDLELHRLALERGLLS